jgi:hypothetical protein
VASAAGRSIRVSNAPATGPAPRACALPRIVTLALSAGRAFGASGTPSAVLVDAEGKVASELAVGASAVLEVAGASRTGY